MTLPSTQAPPLPCGRDCGYDGMSLCSYVVIWQRDVIHVGLMLSQEPPKAVFPWLAADEEVTGVRARDTPDSFLLV